MLAASQLAAWEKVGAVVSTESEWSHVFNAVPGGAVTGLDGTDGAAVSRIDVEQCTVPFTRWAILASLSPS
jgi:hypothetical protein